MLEHFSASPEFALALDREDPLARFRDRFYLRPGQIYLDGNSLGLASKDAEAALQQVLEDWKQYAIDGWTRGERPWFYLAEQLGAMQAHLVGAQPDEVVVTGTTTTNLHTLVAGFYRPEGRRTKIVAQALEFPSDIYALGSQIRLHDLDPAENLVLVPSRDGRTIAEEDLIAAMSDDVALMVLPMVLYRSGQFIDVARVTAAAHDRGILVGWDGCHAAGGVPLALDAWGVDFAFWCSYKYLNGGPGATGALYVNRRHFGRQPGLAGWFGNAKESQFDMRLDFEPAVSAGAWQISTPTVFSSAPQLGTLGLFQDAGMDRLRAKSLLMTEYLIRMIDDQLADLGFRVGTPRDPARRGGHVALEHPEATRIAKALKARQVIPDFRPPNVVRLAPVPLYNTFSELWQTIAILRQIVEQGEHHAFESGRDVVA